MNIYKVIVRKVFKAEMNVNAKNEQEALNKTIDLMSSCDKKTLDSDKLFDSTPILNYEVEKCLAELESLKEECQ